MARSPGVPTGKMERQLRALYLRWLSGISQHENDLDAYIGQFERDSQALIKRMGGQIASLGALAGFPVPKTLNLSPRAGVIYDGMRQSAISAGITSGLNARDVARAMRDAGLDKGYSQLERLARTETVSAYWANTWDSVADTDLVLLWSAETSPTTCQWCLDNDGKIVEDPSIRDHPNGRCTLVPTLASRVPDGTGTAVGWE